jgi:hypothetical protein
MVDPENDLLEHAPERLIVKDSRELIRAVLRDRALDPLEWIPRRARCECKEKRFPATSRLPVGPTPGSARSMKSIDRPLQWTLSCLEILR